MFTIPIRQALVDERSAELRGAGAPRTRRSDRRPALRRLRG